MKRKVYLAALVMCMALAVNGCGSDKETTSTESESTATEQQAEDSPTSLKIPHGIMQDSSSQRDVDPSGRWIPPENSHLSMILSIPPKAL